jgi:hypothetical protein
MHDWPDELTIELYGFGAEPPPDETAQTPTILAWRQVQAIFAGTRVRLQYVEITADLDHSYWLRILDFPTFRVLYAGRELGRTNAAFSSPETLLDWIEAVTAHLRRPRRGNDLPVIFF